MLIAGVATFRRESLTATLASLGAQDRRPDAVVVADNDDVPGARGRAEAAAGAAGLPLRYVHAPARNIARARNAVLDAARAAGARRLAWIDDDEVAPPGWLSGLEADLAPGLAAVFGPCRAAYPDGAPGWMRALSPHDQRVPVTGGHVRCGHTGNALVRLDAPALTGLRFDEAFGRSGSEDTAYFQAGFARGARYGLSEAAVIEPVAPDRLDPEWLLGRRGRSGAAYLRTLPDGHARVAAAALPKAAWCAAGARLARTEAARWSYRLRAAYHRGVLSAAAGGAPADHYGA